MLLFVIRVRRRGNLPQFRLNFVKMVHSGPHLHPTGHSDYKAMKPYIDIAEKIKADAMKLIEEAWDR